MKKLFTILLLLVAFISVKAADILVNSSGLAGSYTTISAAVQAASAGDRILISPQITAYQEDTLVIDKDLTLMPYATNTFVNFQGDIQLNLDDIDNFTIVGFRGTSYDDFKNLFSVLNDTSVNSLSVVNVVDCKINYLRMDQPKTSLYLSYSDVRQLSFSHGDIIGNKIENMYFGNFDYSSVASKTVIMNECTGYNPGNPGYNECMANEPYKFWSASMQSENNLNNPYYHSTECDLFADYIPFGNVDVYSDTCNIIANYFRGNNNAPVNFFNLDFPVNFRNNYTKGKMYYYLLAPTAKGVNQLINNHFKVSNQHVVNLAYCPSSGLFNFADITLHMLNNYDNSYFEFYSPHTGGNSSDYQSLVVAKNSILAYCTSMSCDEGGNGSTGQAGMCDAFFLEIGPVAEAPGSSNPHGILNPSLAHLNLDLTANTFGADGGSHAWINYHGWNVNDNVQMPWGESQSYLNVGIFPPGSKARITYLNLPTQIFDPANIRVKAKAVHGN